MPTADAVSRGGRPRRWTTAVLWRTVDERLTRVDRLAEQAGVSRNEWINLAIEHAVQNPPCSARIHTDAKDPV